MAAVQDSTTGYHMNNEKEREPRYIKEESVILGRGEKPVASL
jgi:hypothetical protein